MTTFFHLLERRVGALAMVIVLVTAAATVPFLSMEPTESASTEPAGPVFDTRDLIDERFVSSVFATTLVAEPHGGDVLLGEPLRELHVVQQGLRDDPILGPDLFSYFNLDTGLEVQGISSLADMVDDELRRSGHPGLSHATDRQVKDAGAALIDRFGVDGTVLDLSQRTFRNQAGDWIVPAIVLRVLSDDTKLGFGNVAINLGGDTESEQYGRDIQAVLRRAPNWRIDGIALDVNLTSQEQGEVAGPFIGATVFAALLLVGVVFRSYWVLAVVSTMFLILLIWLKGVSNLVGFKDDLVLALIVPIAMVSFGVDYAFHSIGRYREEREKGHRARIAVVTGAAAVSGALVLATMSDAVAFLANVTAGIESVIQFGIGAAIALFFAYLLLGVAAPYLIASIEARVLAPEPGLVATGFRILAGIGVTALAVASVLLLVFLLPWGGVIATAATILVTLVLPFAVQSWRLRRAQRRSQDRRSWPRRQVRAAGSVPVDPVGGTLSHRIGAIVATIAKRRGLVLLAAQLLTIASLAWAVQVPSRFDVEDFFSTDTDFVRGLDQVDRHVGQLNGEPVSIYVEGDLTDPAGLARVAGHLERLSQANSPTLARSGEDLRLARNGIFEIFDHTWESPVMAELVRDQTGVWLTDTDGDAIPDTREQIVALTETAARIGVPHDHDRLAMTPDAVGLRFDPRGPAAGADAMVITVAIVNSRDQSTVREARRLLDPVAAAIQADLDDSFVHTTGSAFVREASLQGVIRALQVSLPVAVIACLAVAAVVLRSLRYGLASIVPILMVVAWLYAFMNIAGYAINLVTATIAAVSIGIGIDFALHYISRFREELARLGDRLLAVRVAGEGTGMALVASAVSSAVGFAILAFAPMPLFASYGLLTAVMILMALVATLGVLPSLLIAITPLPTETPVAGAFSRHLD